MVRGHQWNVGGFSPPNASRCVSVEGKVDSCKLVNLIYCCFPHVGNSKEVTGAGGYRLQTARSYARAGGSRSARGSCLNPCLQAEDMV